MTTTKNLGLVKLIFVGTTPPTNLNVVWYDDNVGVKRHKYYDTVTSAWTLLSGGLVAKRGSIDAAWFDGDNNLVIPHNLGLEDIYVSIKELDKTVKVTYPYKSIDSNNVIVYTGEIIVGTYAIIAY